MRSVVKNYLGMIAVATVAVLLLGALAVRIDRSQTPPLPSGIDATPAISGNAPELLVDVRWLQKYQNQVDYIFDLSDIRMYDEGHIPGAHHIIWQDAMRLHTANYGEPFQISLPQTETDYFGHLSLQVPQDARIVLYDNDDSVRASWMLWVMKLNGYRNVTVLDGGLSAWIGAGGELSTEAPPVGDGSIVATPTWDAQYEIRREPLLEKLDDPNTRLIDTRSLEQQKDTVNGTIREGHIPGSINIPTTEVMRADGTFKSVEELQQLFASYGLEPDHEIVVYSLFTTESGNLWVALKIAGFENVVIYQEGFVAWGYNVDLPISTDPYPTPALRGTPAATPWPESTPVASPEATPSVTPVDLTGD